MAGTATVLIDGEIMPENAIRSGKIATSLVRVQAQIKAAGTFDSIKMIINSEGGSCYEGWGIYDYIISLRKPITTIVLGQCCSMATILFMAGGTRLVSEHATFMIHLPWFGIEGNQNDLRKGLAILERESQKLLGLYSKTTGFEESIIAELMANETYLNPEEAIQFKFATGIYAAPMALSTTVYAKRKPVAVFTEPSQATQPSNNTMSTKTKSSFASRLKALLGLAEGAEVKALSVTIVAGPDGTAGKTLDIETVGDNGITVGDPATIEGAEAPDGNYELSDQTKVVITAGAVSEIPPADEEVISEDEPEASTEETVTISKAEYDQFLADRIQASTNVSASADLAKLQGRIKTALGGRDLTAFESQDVIIPKGGKSSTSVSPEARSTPKGKEMTPGEAAIARREERKASAKK